MNPRTGLILRLLGPAIEIACLLALNRAGGRGRSLAGVPVEYPIYAGLALGFGMVLLGLGLARRSDGRPGEPGPGGLP